MFLWANNFYVILKILINVWFHKIYEYILHLWIIKNLLIIKQIDALK